MPVRAVYTKPVPCSAVAGSCNPWSFVAGQALLHGIHGPLLAWHIILLDGATMRVLCIGQRDDIRGRKSARTSISWGERVRLL